jgi:hypothetical protein
VKNKQQCREEPWTPKLHPEPAAKTTPWKLCCRRTGTNGGAEAKTPLLAPSLLVLHLKKRIWIKKGMVETIETREKTETFVFEEREKFLYVKSYYIKYYI